MKKHFASYIIITILGVMINVPFSFSQTNISLNNGSELSFQSGNINLSNYSGEMSEVIYHPPDGGILTAENVIIENDKHTQDKNSQYNKTIYKLIKIKKGKITSNKNLYNISADLIELRDFPNNLIAQLFEISDDTYVDENFLDNLDWDIRTVSPKLKLLAVDFNHNGIFVKIEKIKASINPISNNLAKSKSLVNFELIIENSDIIPVGDSKLATRLTSTLSDLDLQKLTLSLLGKSQFSLINNIQHAKLDICLTANQLFSTTINLYIEYPVLENTLEVEKTELAMKLLTQVKLHKIKIELKDFGLNSRLPISRLNDYRSATENLQNLLVANMPNNGQRLTKPMRKFAYNGGTLTLISQPSAPKPVALIASMLLFPDLLVKEFAISSEHHP